MPDMNLELADLAAIQRGLISRPQAREAGLSTDAVQHLIDSGGWAAVTSRVLARTGAPRTDGQVLMAAVLDGGPGAVISHLTAARWWGLRACPLLPIHITRTSNSSRRTELARTHRVRDLPEPWCTSLRDVPIVRPELLALQLFAVCSEPRAERLVDRLWSDRLLSGASIQRFVDRMGKRGRNGTAGLRRYLKARGPDYVPPASGLESRVMELARQLGIDLRRQVDSGGEHWTGRVDFRHATLPLIVEVQSEAYHSALVDREADRRRIAQLRADGFVVLEITDAMVWSSPAEVVRRLQECVAAAAR